MPETPDSQNQAKDSPQKQVEAADAQPKLNSTDVNTPADQKGATAAEQAHIQATNEKHLPSISIDGTEKATTTNFDGATEVIKDANGQEKDVPLGKLDAGDHTVKLKNGREFLIHVPQNDGKTELPVMFVFSGSAHGQWNIKDFAPESGFSRLAEGTKDDPDHKFIAVYPLPEKHKLGIGAPEEAYAWNAPGSLISDADRKNAGYDDTDYVKSIADLMPKIANVDASHKDWGAVGFSQGGVFLNYLASKEANLFPTMGLVGSSMQMDYNYDIKPGNAQNVDIVNLRGDSSTFPFRTWGGQGFQFQTSRLLRHILPETMMDRIDSLDPIHNENQDPMRQEEAYEKHLGHYKTTSLDLATPIESSSKDKTTVYTSTDIAAGDENGPRTLTITDLATAQHSYPEPDPSGARTNAQPKYTEYDTSEAIVKMFNNYNDRVRKQK
jgi:poly(3-hydroxybutyrate) depolymerase